MSLYQKIAEICPKYIGKPILFKYGIEFCNEQIYSDRINRWTSLNLEDAKDLRDNLFIPEYKEMMKETGTGSDATDGFVNYPRSIEGVEVAFLIRETGANEYKISYRSKGEVNVAEAAQTFGGGGHRNAAGCVIEGDLDFVTSKAVDALNAVMGRG